MAMRMTTRSSQQRSACGHVASVSVGRGGGQCALRTYWDSNAAKYLLPDGLLRGSSGMSMPNAWQLQ